MKTSYIVHYGEIALKKGNRRFFEDRLVQNIEKALYGTGEFVIKKFSGRIFVDFSQIKSSVDVMSILTRVFGIENVRITLRCNPDIDEIIKTAEKIALENKFASFAIRAKRGEKGFNLSSQKVNEIVGSKINVLTGARVDLTNPKCTITIEILDKDVFVSANKEKGRGGLPVGVSGKVGVLISGGIDSPVAAYRVLKRGCLPVFIHFHSAPFTSDASQDKVIDLVMKVMKHQPKTKLHLVGFGNIQKKIVVEVPQSYRVLMYRRFMLRIGEEIAKIEKALALVTGEALSQVASQTLSNLVTINSVIDMPVLRPLIGMDKQEIVDQAKMIDTFDIAIEPHDDCCSFLMPPNPVTSSRILDVEKIESKMDVEGLVNLGLESIKVIDIN